MVNERDMLYDITLKWHAHNQTRDALDDSFQRAINAGVAFTDIGRALGKSEAAIRQKAIRHGWYTSGQRRHGPKPRGMSD